jgi:hypothetical protein
MSVKAGEIAQRLRDTALRDFGAPLDGGSRSSSFQVTLSPKSAPVPVLLRYALELVGLRANGRGEKVAWWVNFSYKERHFELAHEKFGVRLRVEAGDDDEDAAGVVLKEVERKLGSAVRIVEPLLADQASDGLRRGDVTVVNQSYQLRHAYNYFRARALNPALIEDKSEVVAGEWGTGYTFTSGRNIMNMHAFHDLVAAMTAFLSAIEHDLVLALAFTNFNPTEDSLQEHIGSRWAEKWSRIFGTDDVRSMQLRERLKGVVERWRNPYSHGGFEKGHGATIYVHTPGLGALPVALTGVRDSPLFSFFPASETEIGDVFDLFDEIDEHFRRAAPFAAQWIESRLDVRFDEAFRKRATRASTDTERFERLIDTVGYAEDRAVNMDW